jgi:hypothetical protein
MASMRHDLPFKSWLVQRNRKRRMEANPQPPTIATIEWVDAPPATGSTNTNYTISWAGGLPPYLAVINGPGILLNEQLGHGASFVLSVDGTNQPVGDYVTTITDAHGNKLEATTTIS